MPVIRLILRCFVFFFYGFFQPNPMLFRHVFIPKDSYQSLLLCFQNGKIGIRYILCFQNPYRGAAGNCIRNLQFKIGRVNILNSVNVARYPLICFLKCVGIVLFDSLDSILVKTVGCPFLPDPVMGEPCFFAPYYRCL